MVADLVGQETTEEAARALGGAGTEKKIKFIRDDSNEKVKVGNCIANKSNFTICGGEIETTYLESYYSFLISLIFHFLGVLLL